MTAQYKYDNYPDDKLAKAVDVALKASDGAGKAQAIVAGQLLAVGRKRYPADVDFRKWLKLTRDVGLSRARDLIAISEGRKDWDKHLADNREAAYRYRDRVRAERLAAKAAATAKAEAEASRHDVMAQTDADALAEAKIEEAVAKFKQIEEEGREEIKRLKERDRLKQAKKDADEAFEQTVVKAGDDPSINPEGFNVVPFVPANPEPETPELTAATMKATLPTVPAPPITSDIEEDEAAAMDVALLKRATLIALDMVAKGEPCSSDGALASFKVACEMYLSSDVMNAADQKEALAFARLCISDFDDADEETASVAESAGWWPPIYAEEVA
jgi:hypothetical protein